MANDLIRTRHQIEKFYKLKSQLQGVSLKIQAKSQMVQNELARLGEQLCFCFLIISLQFHIVLCIFYFRLYNIFSMSRFFLKPFMATYIIQREQFLIFNS
ncbi:unnamed protein product [Brassica rapa subsp. trilocularis]